MSHQSLCTLPIFMLYTLYCIYLYSGFVHLILLLVTSNTFRSHFHLWRYCKARYMLWKSVCLSVSTSVILTICYETQTLGYCWQTQRQNTVPPSFCFKLTFSFPSSFFSFSYPGCISSFLYCDFLSPRLSTALGAMCIPVLSTCDVDGVNLNCGCYSRRFWRKCSSTATYCLRSCLPSRCFSKSLLTAQSATFATASTSLTASSSFSGRTYSLVSSAFITQTFDVYEWICLRRMQIRF